MGFIHFCVDLRSLNEIEAKDTELNEKEAEIDAKIAEVDDI